LVSVIPIRQLEQKIPLPDNPQITLHIAGIALAIFSILVSFCADESDVAGSYFELLTEQQGLPVKPFDPLEELRRLRRRLAARMQQEDVREEICTDTTNVSYSEPVSLGAVVNQVDCIKKSLAVLHRSRIHMKPPYKGIFRGGRKLEDQRQMPPAIPRYTEPPRGEMTETVNTVLTALGIVGIVFGILSFYRGWEGDLSLGSLVCTSGAAIVAIGISGRCLASRCDLSVTEKR